MSDAPGQAPGAEGQESPAAEQPQQGKTFDEDYVKALRTEAAKHRTEKAAVEAELKKLQDAQLSDAERQSKRLTELEALTAQLRSERSELKTRNEVERLARKMGIVDEDAAYRLLDTASLKLDEDGNLTNAEEVLKALVEARPFLVAQDGGTLLPNVSPANPGRNPSNRAGRFTQEQIRDPAFFKANEAAIDAAYRAGLIDN